ncbi:hypothetical protein EIP86_006086 [Pleurotus ostreatoroseus]|nr:hypothetical protein EIP86_006086 [Pleurotus ostreatoroseus]
MAPRSTPEGDRSAVTIPSESGGQVSPRASIAPGQAARKMQTDAENAREKKLREDDLVNIYSPQLVQCRRCGAKIKLSLKSAWDPFHWTKHRARCLKRPDDVVKALKTGTTKPITYTRTSPPPKAAKLVAPRALSRKRRDSEPALTPPPLTPCSSLSSYTADDSSTRDMTPSSPTIPLRDPRMPATTAFSENGEPRTWPDSASRAPTSFSHTAPLHQDFDNQVRQPSLERDPNSSPQHQHRSQRPRQPPSSAPRCLYPRLLIPDPEDDVNMDDWPAEAWRPIMFQESKIRFSLP